MSDAALPPPSRPWKRRLRNALIVVFTLAVAFVASATMTGFKVADRVPGPPIARVRRACRRRVVDVAVARRAGARHAQGEPAAHRAHA